jgi:hypothetical protein
LATLPPLVAEKGTNPSPEADIIIASKICPTNSSVLLHSSFMVPLAVRPISCSPFPSQWRVPNEKKSIIRKFESICRLRLHFFNPTKSRLKFDFFRLSSTFIFLFDFFLSTLIDFNRLFHQKSKSRSTILIFCNPGALVAGAKCSAVKSQVQTTVTVALALALQIQLADFFLQHISSQIFNCLVVEARRSLLGRPISELLAEQ